MQRQFGDREEPLEVLLDANRSDRLHGQYDVAVGHLPAVPADQIQGVLEGEIVSVVQRKTGVLKGDRLHFGEALLPERRDLRVADDRAQDACRGRRIAVGILTGARSDGDRTRHVTLAVKEPEDHVGRIQPRIDVECREHAVGAAHILRPALLDLEPGALPVVWILFVEIDGRADRLVKARADGNRLEPLPHDVVHVAGDEGQGVHRGDVHAAVPPVARVHDVPRGLDGLDRDSALPKRDDLPEHDAMARPGQPADPRRLRQAYPQRDSRDT